MLPGFSQVGTNNEVGSYKKGDLIVQFKPGTSISASTTLKMAFNDIDLAPVRVLSERMNIWLFQFNPDQKNDKVILKQIKEHLLVQQAQFNHYISHRELYPNDTYFDDQWAFENTGQFGGTIGADIDGPEAWDITTGGITAAGDTIVVAIIDLGCDLNHEDLDFWKNYEEIPGNDIDDDGNGYIDDYDGWNAISHNGDVPAHDHGTHVAGIAGAIGNNGIGVCGVNWNVKILPVACPTDIESSIVEAYGFVYEVRSRYDETDGQHGAFVVASNASFGVDLGDPDDYPIWGSMYDSLGQIGILGVGATANENWNIDVLGDVPTAFASEWLIAVTNTDNMDVKFLQAGFGLTTIDIGAPGYAIRSTTLNNSYGSKTGTSMSAPFITGAIALMFAAADESFIIEYKNNPSEAALQIKQDLLQSVDKLPSLEEKTVTGGRLNLQKALLVTRDLPVLSVNTALIFNKLNINDTDTITFNLKNIGGGQSNYTITIDPQTTWLAHEPQTGTVSGGETDFVQLYFDTDGMSFGTYQTFVLIQDDNNNEILLPVHLNVTQFIVGMNDPSENNDLITWPNPFVDNITIEFSIEEKTTPELIIFDSKGRITKNLSLANFDAGKHKIIWDGTTTNGNSVPPGIYYCLLKTNSTRIVKKILRLNY